MHRVRKATQPHYRSFLTGPPWQANRTTTFRHTAADARAFLRRRIRMLPEEFSNVEGNGYLREPARDAGSDSGRRTAL
jgi:hypothetical protein